MRRANATLSLPLSQKEWRNAVRSFLGGEEHAVFTVEVRLVAEDSRTIAYDWWTSDSRSAEDVAEGITEWLELRCEISGPEHLEAMISIWIEDHNRMADY